jgi:acetyl esterase/lipase
MKKDTMNNLINKILLFIAAMLFLASCSKNDTNDFMYPTDKKVVVLNESYGNDNTNLMDVYLPKNRNFFTKVVLLIHGGGWIAGDKSSLADIATVFSDNGIAAFSINYRLADISKGINYISMLDDINAAIVFLKTKSKNYGCIIDRVSLIGVSAGGHLALLYAYKYGNMIENVISVAGPTNLNDTAFLNRSNNKQLVKILVGGDNPASRIAASPTNYTSRTSTYLFQGKLDSIVPQNQAIEFFKKIKSLNRNNQLIIVNDGGHSFTKAELNQTTEESIQFVDKNTPYWGFPNK